MKYDTHNIKPKSGTFLEGETYDLVKDMITSGQDETEINGQMVSVYSDKIETVGSKLNRVTTIEVKHEPM